MIKIKIIASGSSGNSTVLKIKNTALVVDAGIKFAAIQRALDFQNPAAVLITHEHCDHANPATVKEFLRRGVDVCMTQGTATALRLEPRHNLIIGKYSEVYLFEGGGALFDKSHHDAAEPANFTIITDDGDSVPYITDTGRLNPLPANTTQLLIEANYSPAALEIANVDPSQKLRIRANHTSIAQVVKALKERPLPNLKEVWLMHISKRHGAPDLFKKMAEAAAPPGTIVRAAV